MANDVNITVGADTAKLVASIKEARDAIQNFADRTKNAMGSLTAPFEKFQSILLGVASIAAGGYLFHDIISSTVELASEISKLQKTIGLNLEQANALGASMKLLGINTDDYIHMALRLDRQIRTSNVSLQQMGFTAKDLDLGQKGMMDKAIAKLLEYKEGADRNMASMVLFGRNVDEVFKLLKLGTEGVTERAKELHEKLGLTVTNDDKVRAREYKVAMNELDMAFDGIKKSIGDAVLPYLTRFANWFVENAPSIIANMKSITRTVISYALDLVAGLLEFVFQVRAAILEVSSGLVTFGDKIKDTLGNALKEGAKDAWRNFTSIFTDAYGAVIRQLSSSAELPKNPIVTSVEKTTAELKVQLAELEKERKNTAKKFADFRDTILGEGAAPGEGLGEPKGGNKKFQPVDPSQVKADMDIIQTRIKLADAEFKATEDNLSTQVKIYGITQTEETSLLISALAKRRAIEIAALAEELKIPGITKAERQKILDEQKLAEQKYIDDVNKMRNKQTVDNVQAWNSALSTIQSAWDSQLKGLLSRTTSWAQAMRNIASDLVLKMITEFEKLAIVNPISNMLKEFAPPAEFVTGILKMIMSSVGQVFAGVSGFLAPILGPGAPAAAAGVAAGVEATALGFAASIPSRAIGDWNVPTDMLANIHKGEMIIPAGMAESIRSGGGGGHTINLTINAMDASSFGAALKSGMGDAITRHVSRALQSNPSMRPRYTT